MVGNVARRVVLEIVGWTLVVAGIAAMVLPGPGLLMLFAGLAILSQQYTWAERWVNPVEVRAMKAASESVQTWPRIAMSTVFALWLVGVGVLWTLQPPAPGWWPLDDSWWLLGGWPTGVTLIASGFLAVGLIVYSYRRFRGAEDPQGEAQAVVEE